MQSMNSDPVYNEFPTTYDYQSNRTIQMNWRQNMVSYRLTGPYDLNPLKLLRMVFENGLTRETIPAVFCTDYYAEEIAAEKNGLSNSTFYTDTYEDYSGPNGYKWICPNLTQSTILPEY